ncbi:unnamed protein product [Effrenium voratum]|uniref:Uncharacterized protein n=1 Tax=Effrenium voratum TaxID=2562239 RepID=A0AA36J8W8_9DINO|nr:unnamed protein product [Effrenium voratum]CAJ1429883.1 unnamed protein product [Effrenium voratum]
MQMILQGKPLKADAARKNGIIDAVAGKGGRGSCGVCVVTSAQSHFQEEVPKTNSFMVAAGTLESGLKTAVKAAPLMIAPRSIIKCFDTACSKKSFREGLRGNGRVHQAGLLRGVGCSEAPLPSGAFGTEGAGIDERHAPLKKIGILGARLMGGGIAMCFEQKVVPVVLKAAGDMKKQTKTYGPYEHTHCPKIKANGRGIFIHRGRRRWLIARWLPSLTWCKR